MFEIGDELTRVISDKKKAENELREIWKEREGQFNNFNNLLMSFFLAKKPRIEYDYTYDIDDLIMDHVYLDYSFLVDEYVVFYCSLMDAIKIVKVKIEKKHTNKHGSYSFKKQYRCTKAYLVYSSSKKTDGGWAIGRFSQEIDYNYIFTSLKEELKELYKEKINKIDIEKSYQELYNFD